MRYPFWTLFFAICYFWYILITIIVSFKGVKNIRDLIRDIDKN